MNMMERINGDYEDSRLKIRPDETIPLFSQLFGLRCSKLLRVLPVKIQLADFRPEGP
jgi:hypothetical protein